MTKKITAGQVINCIILILIACTTLYPLIYTVVMSVSTTAEAMKTGFHLYTKEITFMSYRMVFNTGDIYTGYLNTIFRTIFGTVGTILLTSMTAYPLSRKNLPFRRFFTLAVLFTMLFDGGIIPNYLLMKNLHLLDNRLVYILPRLISAYYIMVLKSYFQTSIPESLPESAKIDGASESTILFRIILPISKPVLATIALWTVVEHWNTWMDALIYINSNSKQVLQIFLQRVITQNNTDLMATSINDPDLMQYTGKTIQAATIVVTVFPILAAYPFVQKYFVKGITLGSVKG